MPLGDSITDGSSFDSPDGSGGYRGPLYTLLTTAGYNVDYIGSQTINSSQVPDQNHEGHSGWRIDQLDSNMAGWLASMADPDVVLMHIGTNDFGQNLDTVNAINRLDALILKIATLRPYCHIIVTNLMERGETANTNIQNQFNPYVQARVNAHASAGRRVTFLDMRSAVPLSDMPDSLHPNQNGYNKMAAAWLPAIQAVIGTNGDTSPPAISRARGSYDRTHVEITFSKPVADAAATPANFTLSGGLTISGAVLDSSKRVVTLTTSGQTPGASYTATVNGVVDRTAGALALPANSTVNFNTATQRGYLNNVPESSGYTLACSLDIPTLASYGNTSVAYGVDNRSRLGPFSRVAYYLELQTTNGDLQYAWVSMNAFTADSSKIGVPVLASGAAFQQSVAGMNVFSNVAGLATGTGLTGQIEFWPTNYTEINSGAVPGASGSVYDIGDQPTPGNYGSMQVHNIGAAQTVFALNNWGASSGTQGNVDIGIGNDPAPVNGGQDWTFHHNAGDFTIKTLQVLVQTTGDTTKPTVTSAAATFGRSQVIVRFSEPIAASTVTPLNFSLDGGVEILGLSLAPNQSDVVLTTTAQPVGTPLTLTVSNVRDTSANANAILPGSAVSVAAPALPPEIVANVGSGASGYHLVASIEIPATGNFNASNSAYLVDDRAATGLFSRVAYYVETQITGQASKWVWTSMDAFTPNRAKLCIPTIASGAVFQRNVTNLQVLSNVSGIVNGTTATGGNIEFWPTSYSIENAISVPNASATTYDTGDTRTTSGNFGCMQVHNHDTGANQTLFAINRFGADGSILDMGIGNNPNAGILGVGGTQGSDWTFSSNTPSYARRILHVLVLPGASTDSALVTKVPESANYQLVYSLNTPATGNLVSGTGFTDYAVNNTSDIGGFSRVAYYMELQKTGDAQPRYVWVSMDAFTNLPTRTGVPTPASGAVFQQTVSNMNVVSNVAGVTNGTGITTGNIEFWPTNYSAPVVAGILPGNPGSGTNYDYNDTRTTSGSYGTMQVHNFGAGHTIFALNNWGASGNSANVLCMGIGNNPTPTSGGVDWTFAVNGSTWDLRRVLQVYVLPSVAGKVGPVDTTGPVATGAKGSPTLGRLVVSFDEAVAESAAQTGHYTIPGLTVTGATLLAGNKEVALTTSPQTSGALYTVNISGVRDRSPAGNSTLPGASATFTAYATPAVFANVPEAGDYRLIYQLSVPAASPRWNVNAIPYSVNEARYGEWMFDRVAYVLELDGNWVWVSFDRHTHLLSQIGVPTLSVTSSPFQQLVGNMNVWSNVAGVTPGTGITTGNIEFWGGNYDAVNALNIPNASATVFDFGDNMTSGGHGSMQIHNHGASQVVMAYNNWGSNSGQTSDTAIGSNPNAGAAGVPSGTQGLDWTFTSSASTYTTRKLYVLARPGGSPGGSAPVFYSHPASRALQIGGSVTLTAALAGQGPFTYQWRKNGQPLSGQSGPWLELTNVGTDAAGDYDVVVATANSVSATSLEANVTVNSPPVFSGFSATTPFETAATISLGKLLLAASDPDNDALSVTAAGPASANGGTAVLQAGSILYTPANGFAGDDTFPITITDASGASVGGVVTVTVAGNGGTGSNPAIFTLLPGGDAKVDFQGIPGRSYEIQRSENLTDWTILTTIVAGPTGAISYTDQNPPEGNAFYRIRKP